MLRPHVGSELAATKDKNQTSPIPAPTGKQCAEKIEAESSVENSSPKMQEPDTRSLYE